MRWHRRVAVRERKQRAAL